MTDFHLTGDILLVLRAGTWLGVGVLIGTFHFLTLRWNVKMLAPSGPWQITIALQLGRFALLAGILAIVAGRFGALPLLSATVGIFAARTATVRLGEQA